MRQQSRHLPAFLLLQLAFGSGHGGALQTDLNSRLPGLKADTGAIYRALLRLEEDGEVTSRWDSSHPGPARRIYSITEAGRARLDHWKADIETRRAILSDFLDRYARLPGGSKQRPARGAKGPRRERIS